jgi:hypothetical protein
MSLFKVFDIAGSGMVAQSQRLNVVASNLANADAAAGPTGQPYKARQVVFQTSLESMQRSQASGAGGVTAPTAPVMPRVEQWRRWRRRARGRDRRRQHAGTPRLRPQTPVRRQPRLRGDAQREPGRRDGEHDFGLAFLPNQRRTHEHGKDIAITDIAARSISVASRLTGRNSQNERHDHHNHCRQHVASVGKS